MQEYIVETKICKHCNTNFEITDKDLEFYEKVSPIYEGKKYNIPAPTLCPDCRQQRRLSFRNERKLYKRKCDATGKDIISIYSPDKIYKVYDNDYWWSDKWDTTNYGFDFDFSKNFFKQFENLSFNVPNFGLFQVNLENSDYCHIVANSKDSYLVFASSKLDNCFYGVSLERCNSVVDSNLIKDSENCYECFMLNDCFNLYYSDKCNNCSNGIFLNDSNNCRNCLFSTNLKNKDYYIWNKKVTKEKFEEEKEKFFNLNRYEFNILKEKYYLFLKDNPKCFANIVNGDLVTGDNLINCNKIINCFDCFEVEKSKNLVFCNFGVSNCYDCNYSGHNIELCYESHLAIFNSTKVIFSNQINESNGTDTQKME